MRYLQPLLAGSVLAVSLGLAALAEPPSAPTGMKPEPKTVTLTGELIDTYCFITTNGQAKGSGHASCAEACMTSGIPAGILPEGKTETSDMRFLLTNPVLLAPYAAQEIKVVGTEHPGERAFDVKHCYVMDGGSWKEIRLGDMKHHADTR